MKRSALDNQATRLHRNWSKAQRALASHSGALMISQTLRTQYRVSDIVGWQRDRTLQLNPDFQRRSVWKKGAKSYFIDTILKGFPVPIIFLRDMRSDLHTLKARRDVVDGQQRIRTLLAFIDKSLLDDFEPERDAFVISKTHNKELGGKSFVDLGEEDRQKILDYQFSVHSFPADTDDRLILQIFSRMNATGYKLNSQELRNAEFYGEFKTLAYDLATEQLQRWRDWKIFNADSISRMNEVEMTSELLMLMTHGILDKRQKDIFDFYEKYEEEFPFSREVSRRFRATFDTVDSLLGKELISTLFRTRTIFFGLFVAVYGLQFGLRRTIPVTKDAPKFLRQKAAPIKNSIVSQLIKAATEIKEKATSADVAKASRGASSDARQRKTVIRHLVGADNDPCRNLR